jgi:predicted deacylase
VRALPRHAGDAVKADEVIAQIETDKVTMDVRAPAAGVIDSIQARRRAQRGRCGPARADAASLVTWRR